MTLHSALWMTVRSCVGEFLSVGRIRFTWLSSNVWYFTWLFNSLCTFLYFRADLVCQTLKKNGESKMIYFYFHTAKRELVLLIIEWTAPEPPCMLFFLFRIHNVTVTTNFHIMQYFEHFLLTNKRSVNVVFKISWVLSFSTPLS